MTKDQEHSNKERIVNLNNMEFAEASAIAQKYPGMRCKINKDGDIVLYANFFFLISDLFKKFTFLFR